MPKQLAHPVLRQQGYALPKYSCTTKVAKAVLPTIRQSQEYSIANYYHPFHDSAYAAGASWRAGPSKKGIKGEHNSLF